MKEKVWDIEYTAKSETGESNKLSWKLKTIQLGEFDFKAVDAQYPDNNYYWAEGVSELVAINNLVRRQLEPQVFENYQIYYWIKLMETNYRWERIVNDN